MTCTASDGRVGACGVIRAYALSVLLLSGCSFLGFDPCDVALQREVRSPGARYVAAVFHKECGATTGFNTQVALRRAGTRFDTDSGQVLAIAGRHNLDVKWTSDNRLTVVLPDEKVYVKNEMWRDVKVAYSAREP